MKRKAMVSTMLSCVLAVSNVSVAFAQDTKNVQVITEVANLETNYQVNPMGITKDSPRFSWNMISNVIGKEQKSYQIIVKKDDSEGTVVWDSGNVESGSSTGVLYEGESLEDETRYSWIVTVKDTAGNEYISNTAYFETGTDFEGISWVVPSAKPGAGNVYVEDSEQKGGAPLLRMESRLEGLNVSSARLYITSLGMYDAYINGQKVVTNSVDGEAEEYIFAPGWTDYRYYTNYQTYDVTEQLANAESSAFVLGISMNKGWYAGGPGDRSAYELVGVEGDATSSPDARQLALLAKLVVTYEDGSTQIISTDDGDWKSIDSAVVYNDIFFGEDYDANRAKELKGWNEIGFDASEWFEVSRFDDYTGDIRPNSEAMAYFVDELERTPVSGYTYKEEETQYPEIMPPESGMSTEGVNDWYGEIVEHPVDVTGDITIEPGEILILDMGQNMVGVPEIEVSGEKGTVIQLRHAEVINDGKTNPTLPVENGGSDGPKGTIHYRALRNENAQIIHYIMSDEEIQTYHPTSTFMGFRYVEVTADRPITLHSIKGKVITSAVDQTGYLETSNQDVNQLINNVLWGQRGNFLTLPTDCPQRDERKGWEGDAQVFAQTAVYNFDVYAFMDNFVEMMQENCKQLGTFGKTVPTAFGLSAAGQDTNSGWSDAGVIIPWVLYQQTGDTSFIEDNYKYMDYYMDNVNKNGYHKQWFGDWLAFSAAHLDYVNAVFQIYTTQLMAQMAEVIGLEDKIEKYNNRYEELKANFLAPPVIEEVEKTEANPLGIVRTGGGFVYENGDLMSYGPDLFVGTWAQGYIKSYKNNAQTALLWALKCNLYRDEEHKQYLIEKLCEEIRNENREIRPEQEENTLAVGFLGVNVLLPVLSEVGADDVAYDLLLQEQLPSWLYAVKNGATTIWERWNSYSDESFGAAGMNSFNHFSYGACAEWMYKYMAGISQSDGGTGFKEIVLQPEIDETERITNINGRFDSLYGTIESNWKSENGALVKYDTVIPANTSAELYLPISEEIMEDFEGTDGVIYEGMEKHNGKTCSRFKIQSGGYHFIIEDGALHVSIMDGYIVE